MERALSPGDGSLQEDRPDWQAVLDLAFRHGISALVCSGLDRSGLEVPPEVRAELRTRYLGAVLRSEVSVDPTLRRVLLVLRRGGFSPVLIKGGALAYTVYPEAACRTLGDVDLLLPDHELEAASAILRRSGFWVNGAEEASHHLRAHYSSDGQMGVELHCDLLPAPHPYSIDVPGLDARARWTEAARVEVRIPSPVDSLHLACVHLAYAHCYRWFPLRSLADILAITLFWREELDWDLLQEITGRSRTAGAVYWPLKLSREWLGAPVPDAVLDALGRRARTRRLVEAVVDPRYLLEGEAPPHAGAPVLYDLILDLSLYDGCPAREQAGVALKRLLPPPEAVGHLPPHVAGSRLRYAAHLMRPSRFLRGLLALGRLLGRLATRRLTTPGRKEASQATSPRWHSRGPVSRPTPVPDAERTTAAPSCGAGGDWRGRSGHER